MDSSGSPAGSGGRTALVLDAGGARSAYQVGALQVLLPALEARGETPQLLLGTSAGALISAALTSYADLSAEEQAARLMGLLEQATKPNVIQPLWRQVPVVLTRYASETLGLSWFRLRGIFGTGPLASTLGRAIDWSAVHRNVERGLVATTAVTATAVRTGQVVLFTESHGSGPLPEPPREHHRRYVRTQLGVEHLMASSAIPALFPSVRVEHPEEARGWYLDGATRRRAPLAPAVELGADRIVVVGTGSMRPPADDPEQDQAPVDLGDSGATLLGAVMDDPLRYDLRRLTGVNMLAADPDVARALERYRDTRDRPPYRAVPFVAVLPDRGDELAALAMEVFRTNHRSLRGTLGDPDLQVMHRLLGSDSPLQGELLSYLMFDRDFFHAAAELGHRDAKHWVRSHPDLWRTQPLDPQD